MVIGSGYLSLDQFGGATRNDLYNLYHILDHVNLLEGRVLLDV